MVIEFLVVRLHFDRGWFYIDMTHGYVYIQMCPLHCTGDVMDAQM